MTTPETMRGRKKKAKDFSSGVTVSKSVEYDRLRNLLVASYLLGQEMGLRGFTYEHPDCTKQRENLIHFIFNGEMYAPKTKL